MYNNFKFIDFSKKENANKFIFVGVLLLVLGTMSLLFRHIGIKIVSLTLGLVCLILAYFNLKVINELRRYESKATIRPYLVRQAMLIAIAILLFIFPEKIQGLFSSIAGAYLVVNQLMQLIASKKNTYTRFTSFNGFLLISGLVLILSPLFLSGFIASICALVLVLVGFQLISTGNNLKKF